MTDPHNSIEALRAKFGKNVVIVGHHYQEETVIRHTDLRGDSLELARRTAALDCDHIVFCGVYFMAESAAVLAKKSASSSANSSGSPPVSSVNT